jgi:hypothetical protein
MGVSSRAVPFTVVPSLGQALRALSVVCMGAALFQPVPASAGPGGPGTPAPPGPSTPAPALSLAKAADDPDPQQQQVTVGVTDPFIEFFRKTEILGLVDTYYTYNFNEPPTGTFTPLHSFDLKHNQFSVSLLELAFSKATGTDDRIGFRFDLQYGQTAQVFNTDPLDNNNLLNVQQAYVSYLVPGGLTFEVGKFVTPVGSEATEAHLNNNYSRGLLYQYGPFYHVGTRVSFPLHEKFTIGGMFVNGWNATGDNNSGKTFGANLTWLPSSKFSFIQNVLWGPEQTDNADDTRTFSDTNLALNFGAFTTGANYIYAVDEVAGESIDWQGLALYFKGQLGPVFAIAPRFEWYKDPDGFVFGAGEQTIKEFTLTFELKHPRGLITRFEYRRDWSDVDYFTKDGDPTDNQNIFTVGFIVPFTSRPVSP